MKKEIIKSISSFYLPNRYTYKEKKQWEDDITKILKEEKLPISLKNSRAEGYKIVTSEQTIFILIDGEQQCCEEWGYEACSEKGIIDSNDDFKDFIGAELFEVSVVQPESHNSVKIYDKLLEASLYDCTDTFAEFVNFKTSNGLLQFSVYNCQNGYYGHPIYIKFNDTEIESHV